MVRKKSSERGKTPGKKKFAEGRLNGILLAVFVWGGKRKLRGQGSKKTGGGLKELISFGGAAS